MKAAFEINKGEIDVMTLSESASESTVERCIDLNDLLNALEGSFLDLELGRVQSPARPEIVIPGKGFSLSMMAWRPGDNIAVKVVNVFDGQTYRTPTIGPDGRCAKTNAVPFPSTCSRCFSVWGCIRRADRSGRSSIK